ncbi:MAG: DUF4124 domain-containing protein [Pseudomonadota bacterium]|nr:DUF4124 domain-containing protein [Pseudomonadota bacterium]
MRLFARIFLVFSAGCLFVSGLTPAAIAETYRWVEDGRVHYGDHPPVGAEAEIIRSDPSMHQGIDSRPSQAAEEAAQAAREQRLEKESAEKQKAAAAAERSERCDQARQQLQWYEQRPRVFLPEQQRWLDEGEREQRLQGLRESIRENCD